MPPDRFGQYLREVDALFRKFGYAADLNGHFGQGCLHCRIDFDLESEAGIVTFQRFLEEAADLRPSLRRITLRRTGRRVRRVERCSGRCSVPR